MSLYARSACDKRQERRLINYYLSRFASATRNVFFFFLCTKDSCSSRTTGQRRNVFA